MNRYADRTDIIITGRKRIIRGSGAVAAVDSLRPRGLARRILSRDSRLWPWWQSLGALRLLDRYEPDAVAGFLRGLLAPDGQRFVMATPVEDGEEDAAPPKIRVVLNWHEEFRDRE